VKRRSFLASLGALCAVFVPRKRKEAVKIRQDSDKWRSDLYQRLDRDRQIYLEELKARNALLPTRIPYQFGAGFSMPTGSTELRLIARGDEPCPVYRS